MTNAMNTMLAVLGMSVLRSLLLAAVAALGLKICGTNSTAMRLFVWRAVLCASLAMPFLGQLLPPVLIPAPQPFRIATGSPASKPAEPSTIASSPNLPFTGRTLDCRLQPEFFEHRRI